MKLNAKKYLNKWVTDLPHLFHLMRCSKVNNIALNGKPNVINREVSNANPDNFI